MITTAQLDSDIAQLEEGIAQLRSQLKDAQEGVSRWQAAEAQDARNNASYSTRQHTAERIAFFTKEVERITGLLDTEVKELERKKKLREAIEQAALRAIERGVTPEEAYRLAEAEVEAQKRTTRVVNIILIVLLIMAIGGTIWFIRKAKAQ